ncbi:FecR domain-containing protein [Paraglaciecola agarilytica]|uniref:FecR family protein n=1 Tax=Paraglaciecola chathamensis TaxID=368405 RepID=UPI001C091DB6|nr:FecR domain-containing protein [Paraglaciecola agarilytica]MBU3016765.1 FecR domain-containing protein [Paraglaciecola agarilytica]
MNSTEQQALDWLTQLYKGEPSEADKINFVQWLKASKENAKAYKKLEQQWRDITLVNEPFLQTRSVGVSKKNNQQDTKRNGQIRNSNKLSWIGLAASVLFVAVTYVFWPSSDVQPRIWQTGIGETQIVKLSDGSEVTLDAASSISVEINDTSRRVNMQYGNAYFDVHKGLSTPFKVITSRGVISVLGTEFEVRTSEQNMRLIVAEGSVSLSRLAGNDDMQELDVLTAGDRVWIPQEGSLKRDTIALDKIATWKDGRLTYVDTPLSIVVEDANRYRKLPIHIDSDSLKEMLITTSFSLEESEKLLTALESHYSVQVKYDSDGVYLSDK